MGLLELSAPISFEPVGPVTTVFFDDKNQQVFSVRSGGATGVTIKNPNNTSVITLRIADLGPIISIKLSPCQSVLSVQRAKNQVDFMNVSAPETEYSQVAKAKNCLVLGFVWTCSTEVVFLTDIGIEIYTVNSEKRNIKYMRSTSVAISWFCNCPKENYIVTASKLDAQTLQVWAIRASACYKIGNIESNAGTSIKEKDAAMVSVYGKSYLAVSLGEDGDREVRLYQICPDSVSWSHTLDLQGVPPGSLGIQVLDNLLVVHLQVEGRSRVFDIRLGEERTGVSLVQPSLPPTAICQENSGYSQPLSYSPSWVLFRPSVLVDARTGRMWTLQLKLDQIQGGAPLTQVKLLLNREAGKPPLLKLLHTCLSSTLPLTVWGDLLAEVVAALKLHLNQATPPPTVVLDQPDLFTHLFSSTSSHSIPVERLQAGLIELLLCLARYSIPPRQFFHELLINLAVKSDKFYQLHQLLQYGVLGDSKPIACLLLSLESAYKPARQLALDMMARLGTATEEMIEIFLSEGKLIPALQLVKTHGLVDAVSARKFLEAAERTQDSMLFFNVFNFFEERNLRLRGSGKFSRGEQCESYVQRFKAVFLQADQEDSE